MPVELSAVQLVALILVTVLAVGAAVLIPRIWRGELVSVYEHASEGVWLWGEPLRRGFLRGLHLGILSAVVLVFLVFATADLEPTGHIGPVVGTAVGAFFVLLGLNALVVLFNRPRWAVPPRYRDQPGAISEWRAALRGRRGPRHPR